MEDNCEIATNLVVSPNKRSERTAHSVRFLAINGAVSCGPPLKRGVDMIDIANDCVKKTYKSDFWRNCCVNHHTF
jgi:hypothetical protein